MKRICVAALALASVGEAFAWGIPGIKLNDDAIRDASGAILVLGQEGSYAGVPGRTKDSVFDGDPDTFYDPKSPFTEKGWAGIQLKSPRKVGHVRYLCRSGYGQRMRGILIQGANKADFSDAVTLLTANPPENWDGSAWADEPIAANGQAFLFLRAVSSAIIVKDVMEPGVCCGNLAELEFYEATKTVFRNDGLDQALDLAERTLAYVEKSRKLPTQAAWLDGLKSRALETADTAKRADLEREVRALRRQILFLHPDLSFDTLLVSQRGMPYSISPHMVDQYLGRNSKAGPGLMLLRHWKDAPEKEPLLKGDKALPEGTVWNPDLHWDADRVVFAFCDHTDRRTPLQKRTPVHSLSFGKLDPRSGDGYHISRVDPKNPVFDPSGPTNAALSRRYFIYEAAMDGSWVRQLTGTPQDPMKTRDGRQTVLIEDADPCYLPDGGIAFTSTRCQSFGRCHGNRYAPAFLLYRMDGDGRDIRPLSFGEANEWEPSVLNDGRIAYTRWDYIDRNAVPWQSLWVMRPDGTGTAHFFGNYTPVPKVMSEVKAIPGSHLVAATGGAHHFFTAGCPILIDISKGEDGPKSMTKIDPSVSFPGCPWTEGGNGFYADPYPVNDTLFFASYAQEAFHDHDPLYNDWGGVWPATNSFAVCLIDTLGGREVIYRDAACNTFSPIPVRKTRRPPVLPSQLPAGDAPDYGVCAVDNVYDCRVPLAPGSVKALRLNRILCQPTPAIPDIAHGGYSLYKKPLGTVPVAPDGSVSFKMPAGIPVQLQALGADGMAVLTMRSFIYVHKGEQLRCVGCHEDRRRAPQAASARPAAAKPAVDITPPAQGADGVSFARQVRPVLDRHCVSCHSAKLGKAPKSGLDFSAGNTQGGMDLAYWKLVCSTPQYVKRAMPYNETGFSVTNDYFAAASPLTALLRKGHHDVRLSQAEWDGLVIWMDLNAQYLENYNWPTGKEALGTCGLGTSACRCDACWVREGGFNKPSPVPAPK